MTYTSNPKLNSLADCYKRQNTIKVIADLLMNNFNLNGAGSYISRDNLFKYASASFDTTYEIRNARYIKKDGSFGDYCINKALDLVIKALRDAGCIIDKKGTVGNYCINEDIYRFFKENKDKAFDSIIENFDNNSYTNLPKIYVTSNPKKVKAVLIKKVRV